MALRRRTSRAGVAAMWTIEQVNGGARVLTDGHKSVFVTKDQEAELAKVPTKGEFQDVLRKIMKTNELPFDEVDLDSIRDAAAGVAFKKPSTVRGHGN